MRLSPRGDVRLVLLLGVAFQLRPALGYAQGRRQPPLSVSSQEARCERTQTEALYAVEVLTREAHEAMGECNRCTSSYAAGDVHQCTPTFRDDLVSFLRQTAAIREALQARTSTCRTVEMWELRHQATQIRRRVRGARDAARVCDFHWYQPAPANGGENEPIDGGVESESVPTPAWLGVGLFGLLPGIGSSRKGTLGLDLVVLRAVTNPSSRPRLDLGVRGELGATFDLYGGPLGAHQGAVRMVAGLEGRLMLGAGNDGLAIAATVAYGGMFPGFPWYAPPSAIAGHGILLRGGGEYYFGRLGITLNGELWTGSSTVGSDNYTHFRFGLGIVVLTAL